MSIDHRLLLLKLIEVIGDIDLDGKEDESLRDQACELIGFAGALKFIVTETGP